MRPNPQEIADLVAFTEEILDGKVHFFVQCELCQSKKQHVKGSPRAVVITISLFFASRRHLNLSLHAEPF